MFASVTHSNEKIVRGHGAELNGIFCAFPLAIKLNECLKKLQGYRKKWLLNLNFCVNLKLSQVEGKARALFKNQNKSQLFLPQQRAPENQLNRVIQLKTEKSKLQLLKAWN